MKSAIYTVNNGTQAVAVNQLINLGSVIRRFGNNLSMQGNAIVMNGQGYYHADVQMTIESTASGLVTVTLLKDGVPVPGAIIEQQLTLEEPATVGLHAMLREMCPCADSASSLTLQLGGTAAEVLNIATIVEKV